VYASILSSSAVNTALFSFATMLFTLCSLFTLLLQPFKPEFSHHATISAAYFLLFAMFLVSCRGIELSATQAENIYLFICVLSGCIPLLYMMIVTLHWMWRHKKFVFELPKKCHHKAKGYIILP